ncbi:MAG: hypothetical protein ACPGVH_01705 [Chitinophagales bacterium]
MDNYISINRAEIIKLINQLFIDDKTVNAFWLEGADGLGNVDEYSDIDIVLDVDDGFENCIFETFEQELNKIGSLDLNVEDFVDHPKIRTKFYHIENSNEYLILDFSIQSNSRNSKENIFTKGDIVSFPKIIFDKKEVVKFSTEIKNNYSENFKDRISIFKARFKQHSRVLKYVERNLFLEASMYYRKYVTQPIVELMRMKYTPKYHYLHLIHISNHIPKEEKLILEKLYKINSLADIKTNTKFAQNIFNDLVKQVEILYIP